MTVGGNTKGMEVIASTIGRARLRLCASHQARGVPSSSSNSVVVAASCSVSQTAVNSLNFLCRYAGAWNLTSVCGASRAGQIWGQTLRPQI